MLNEAALFERAALTLLRGEKINQSFNTLIAMPLYNLLQRMHAAHLIAAEPQSYVQLIRNAGFDTKFLGNTHIHPQSSALLEEAQSLLSVCEQKGKPISNFEIFGLNHDKRSAWRDEDDFKIDQGKVGVLVPGDITSLWQAMNLIRQRTENPEVRFTSPIIIQNTGHFWESLFTNSTAHWSKEVKALERLNIFVSAGAVETADILATVPFGRKMDAQDVQLKLTDAPPVLAEQEVFFTTDSVKLGHTIRGQEHFYAGDSVRRGIDVIGPFPSADEQTYSLEGNADDKMGGTYERHAKLVATIGRAGVEKLYTDAGLDVAKVKVITNDGGWLTTLENKSGERKIDLFPERLFPNTAHKLNPIQMGPGVEYAYMKRTDGLEYMMTNLEKRVGEIVERPGSRFRRGDLSVYDTSVFMSVPLSRMLDAIEAGDPYDAAELGVVSVFASHKLGIADKPYRGPYTGVVDTIDYFIPKEPHGNLLTRSQIPDWFMRGPNVEAHRLSKMVRNVVPREAETVEAGHKSKINMGILGSLDALTQRRSSDALDDLKARLLAEFKVSTRLGPQYWDTYRNRPELVLKQAGGSTNTAYLAGTRKMLDSSRVFFAGNTSRETLSDKQKVKHLGPILDASVRNQVFNHIDLVIDADSPVGKIALDLIQRKQELGFVQQRTEHIAHFVQGNEAAASKINEIVRRKPIHTKQIKRQFFSDGQVEKHDCATAVVYCSATNCNKALLNQYDRLGYLLAINGFSLKVGGGNDGLMKAVADGFNKGKKELLEKGYDFPNQLILIQCVDTEAIEKRYEGEGLYRCHGSIKPRMADLQQALVHINGAGGLGSDREYLGDLESRMEGLIDPAKNQMIWFNNQMQTTKGTVGVHDFYKDTFSTQFLKGLGADNWTLTAEETVAQACLFREKQMFEHTLPLANLRATLKDAHNKAALAQPIGHFRPPFNTWLGVTGELPRVVVSRIAADAARSLNQA